MIDADLLAQVSQSVLRGGNYRKVHADFVQRLAAQELSKGRSVKEAVKAVRSKLHQVGGAFQVEKIPYQSARSQLDQLPCDLKDLALQDFCLSMVKRHTSTRERLPIIQTFFKTTLASISPIHSILDLACGLNALSLPWIPLAPDATYYACDIYSDMIDFVNHFLNHVNIDGGAELCDLTQTCPEHPAQVTFLLKILPCLEQIEKDITLYLLDKVPSEHILISYPIHSLGGRGKGMAENYRQRFENSLSQRSWRVQRYDFPGEMAFLVSRG